MEYTFTLKYQLAEDDRDPDALVERLGEAGCDDALVGIGQPGRLALEFTREAESADTAVRSALADVRRAVASARLIEVAPDLVGLTDVAEIVGVSRQNMRKLMLAHPGASRRRCMRAVRRSGTWRMCWPGCRPRATIRWPRTLSTWRKWPCRSTWRKKVAGCRVRLPRGWKPWLDEACGLICWLDGYD